MAGVAVALIGIAIEGFRWQMIPAYLVFAIAAGFNARKFGAIWRAIFGLPLILGLALSVLLCATMPIVDLPKPSGPFAVGTFSYSAIDTDRPERYEPSRSREIFVQVSYPALAADSEYRGFWEGLYGGESDWIAFFSSYLQRMKSSSIRSAQAVKDDLSFPVIFYNPAMGGLTDWNTFLVEELVSHGYIVFAIAHSFESFKVELESAGTVYLDIGLPADVPFTQQEMTDLAGVSNSILAMSDHEYRTRLMTLIYGLVDHVKAVEDKQQRLDFAQTLLPEFEALQLNLSAEDLLRVALGRWFADLSIESWVKDTQFVADQLLLANYPVDLRASMDADRIGVMGMSYGGAAAGEFCKVDSRCKAGANLDGTQFGSHWKAPLLSPFLVMYSATYRNQNDFAYSSSDGLYSVVVQGAEHTDFSDVPYFLPSLQLLGVLGPIGGQRMVEVLNSVLLSFFDEHLRGFSSFRETVAGIQEVQESH